MFRSKNLYFTSEIDKMLKQFNETHEKSPAQQAEITKYKEIYKKRDGKSTEPTSSAIHLAQTTPT